jgi:hypothetical protein
VHAAEVAVDLLVTRNLLDAIDGGGLRVVDLPGLVETAHFDQLVIVVVEGGGEMGGGARAHAPADGPAVEHHDGRAGAPKLVSDREASNPCADHDRVGQRVARERRRILDGCTLAPYRCAALGAGVHRQSRCWDCTTRGEIFGSNSSTHSLRAGTITSLADAGATIAEIRDVTGHAEGSAAMLLGYMRRQGAGVKQIKKLGL